MKIFVRNIVSLFLAAIVLIATSGFTVFHHSCQTSQTSELSLIIADFSCNNYKQKADVVVQSCCRVHNSPVPETCDTKKCCDTETILVKVDIPFDTQNYLKKKSYTAIEHSAETAFEIEIPERELSHIVISNDLPPPLAGKALHIFLHQLNIPYRTV